MSTEEWIDKYYLNELTIDELKEFEKLLIDDVELREEFEFQKNLQMSIKSRESDILKSKLQHHEQAKKVSQASGWKKWLVAASILVLIGVAGISYYNYSIPNFNKLYTQNYEVYPNTEFNIIRGENSPSLEYRAFAAYERQDYTQAISLFAELKKNSSPGYLDFYLAQSYLANGNYKKALIIFEEVIQNQEVFVEESHWFAALSALKLNKKRVAKKHLNYLLVNRGYKSSIAQKLKKKLD